MLENVNVKETDFDISCKLSKNNIHYQCHRQNTYLFYCIIKIIKYASDILEIKTSFIRVIFLSSSYFMNTIEIIPISYFNLLIMYSKHLILAIQVHLLLYCALFSNQLEIRGWKIMFVKIFYLYYKKRFLSTRTICKSNTVVTNCIVQCIINCIVLFC